MARGMAALNRAEFERYEAEGKIRHEGGLRIYAEPFERVGSSYPAGKYHSVKIWYGKKSAPDYNYLVENEKVESLIAEKIAAAEEAKAHRRRSKVAGNSKATAMREKLVVGTLLHGSWGYDQTNCEFYEVVGRPSEAYAEVRPIAGETVEGSENFMSCSLRPVKGAFINKNYRGETTDGKPIRKLISSHGLSFEHFTLSPTSEDSKHYSSWYA